MANVLVTGGTSGLGRAIGVELLKQGCQVHLVGRNPRQIRGLLSSPGCRFVKQDLMDLVGIAALANLVKKERIDCLINSAGSYSNLGVEISDRDCERLLTVNLLSPILLIKRVYSQFRAERKGTIVSINSLAGLDANFAEAAYSASKHGMRGFVRSLQIDAAGRGVRILDYYLGAMKTRMTVGRQGFETFIEPADAARRIVVDALSNGSFLATSQVLRRVPR